MNNEEILKELRLINNYLSFIVAILVGASIGVIIFAIIQNSSNESIQQEKIIKVEAKNKRLNFFSEKDILFPENIL